jgi:hypothetical protein
MTPHTGLIQRRIGTGASERGGQTLSRRFVYPGACRPFSAALPASSDALRLRFRQMTQLVFQHRIQRGFVREKVPEQPETMPYLVESCMKHFSCLASY